jgi:chromosome transmission fidelity protein 18
MYEEIYKTLAKNVLGNGSGTAGRRMAAQYRHLVTDGVLQLEFAPLLNRIISPPLKPVYSVPFFASLYTHTPVGEQAADKTS